MRSDGRPSDTIPGEWNDIAIELEATTWTLEPGHVVRLAVAGTDWPNCWPPPGPVTLDVDVASIELVLPLVDLPASHHAFQPGSGPSPDEADGVEWRIEHDVLGRETRVATRYGGTYDGLHGAVVGDDYRGELGVSTVDPARAWARGQRELRDRVARSHRHHRVDAGGHVRCRGLRRHDPSAGARRRRRDRRPHAGIVDCRAEQGSVLGALSGKAWQAAQCAFRARRARRRPRCTDRGCRVARPRPRRPPGSAGGTGIPAVSRLGSGVSPVRICCSTCCCSGTTDSSALVYGCCGLASTSSASPISTIRPRYITAIRSAMFQASPRSWVTAMMERPRSSTSERSRARISPRIDASSDATGSSASSSCGDERDRPGDQHTLALAARELVRVAADVPLGRAQSGTRQRVGDELGSSPASR